MRVLFLNPPRLDDTVMVKEGRCMQRKGAWGYVMAPVTMVTMATMARNDGHDATVMDCPAEGTTFARMVEAVRRLGPDIVYVNTSTPSIDDDLAAAATVKATCPGKVTVALFGIHPTSRYSDLLAPPGSAVDCCVLGEPEQTVRELTAAVSAGKGPGAVAGLAWVDGAARLAVTAPRPPIADLDELPIPDWSLVDTGNYRLPLNGRRFLLVNTNRGCPYRCSFCNAHLYYGRAPRRRSAAHVVRELTNDVRRFGVLDFMFWAEEFILEREPVLELCEAIASSGLGIRWVCNSRVDAVTPELLSAVRKAGCWNIAYGIESGDQRVLDAAKKGITLEQTRLAVAMAKEAGLQVTGHVIIGLPGDTRETIMATGRFVDSLDLDFVQYYCAMPYPGTGLYRDACDHGWLASSDWKRWEHNVSVLDYAHLSAAETMRLRRSLMRRWYLRPGRIARTMKNHVRRPSDVRAFLSGLGGFLRWM